MPKVQKSVKLTSGEKDLLIKYRESFASEVACAAALNMKRARLNRLLILGSASEDTVSTVRKFLLNQSML